MHRNPLDPASAKLLTTATVQANIEVVPALIMNLISKKEENFSI